MSAAVTRVWAIQEIANPRRACDASRMTTFGAVSIVWRMSTTPILTGYRATNTRSLLPPVAGLKLLFLVRVPAARSSLGLRDVPDVGCDCGDYQAAAWTTCSAWTIELDRCGSVDVRYAPIATKFRSAVE